MKCIVPLFSHFSTTGVIIGGSTLVDAVIGEVRIVVRFHMGCLNIQAFP